jgi:glycosyltransferase involved in cell wall biosynthesis
MKIKKVIFIVPLYNAQDHLEDLSESLLEQSNNNWECIFINDMSSDNSLSILKSLSQKDKRFLYIDNKEKKWALRNVIENSKQYENNSDIIIAIMDGDDCLCNENTVELLINEYEQDPEVDTVWTAHTWDINSMNISKKLPDDPPVNPYEYPWVSSHLKTFKANLLKNISYSNFKDLNGNWFKRGYDQALYLPLLYKSRKRKYLNEICYLYRINSSSLKIRDWNEKDQMDTVRLVRSRGLVW